MVAIVRRQYNYVKSVTIVSINFGNVNVVFEA